MTVQTSEVPVEKLPAISVLKERSVLRILSILIFLSVWSVLGMILDPLFLPTPFSVVRTLFRLLAAGEIIGATGSSLWLFVVGFCGAVIVAIPLGIFLGLSKPAFHFSDLYITIFWSTPTIALLPLFVIWFGLTFTTKLIIVFLSGFWPTVINTQVGVQNVDDTLTEVGVAFGGRREEILRKITLPASIPYVVAGLRIACGRAVIGVIVAELYTSVTGLGAMMTYYSNFFQTANYFACLLVLIAFSLMVTESIRLLETRFTHWKGQRQQ